MKCSAKQMDLSTGRLRESSRERENLFCEQIMKDAQATAKDVQVQTARLQSSCTGKGAISRRTQSPRVGNFEVAAAYLQAIVSNVRKNSNR